MRASDTWTELERRLAPFPGRRVLDIGCGHGALARALTRAGARVAALDPAGPAVEAARRAAPDALVVRAGAERLPFADGVFDACVLLNSLHHVPGPAMAAALAEALRVLRPEGALVVVEPLAEGPFFEAMRPLEDETAIRVEAQAVLGRLAAAGGAALVETVEYMRPEWFAGVDAFIARVAAVEPGRALRAAALRETIAERFARLGVAEAEGTRLDQPLRLHHFRPA